MAETSEEAAPPEANERGEVTLKLEGVEYHLRPSREAISAIERQLRPLTALHADAQRYELTLEEMAIIAAEMMRAYGKSHPDDPLVTDYRGAKPERLADLIFEVGAPRICVRLLVVLTAALTGGVTAAGELKAQTATTG